MAKRKGPVPPDLGPCTRASDVVTECPGCLNGQKVDPKASLHWPRCALCFGTHVIRRDVECYCGEPVSHLVAGRLVCWRAECHRKAETDFDVPVAKHPLEEWYGAGLE